MKKTDYDKLDGEQRTGRLAQEVLNNPIYRQAWDEVSKALANQRRKCPVKDTELAYRLIIAEQVMGNVKSCIETFIQTGKFAEATLTQETDRENWLNRLKRSGFSRI